MQTRRKTRRLALVPLQPLLNIIARRNRRARELAAAMRQLRCVACGSPLDAHISTGNRWTGCRKNGAR